MSGIGLTTFVIALLASSGALAQTKTYTTTVSGDGKTITRTSPNGTWTISKSQNHDGSRTTTSTWRPAKPGYQAMGDGGYKPLGR
jgi:hypothetical protein